MKKILIIIIILGIIALLFYSNYQASIKRASGEESETLDFVVEPGEGANSIMTKLLEAGLIDSEFFYKLYLWKSEKGAKIQAGNYTLNRGMSLIDIIDRFERGEVEDRERSIKILEGWTLNDMEEYFVKNDILEEGEFLDLVTQPVATWPFTFAMPAYLETVPARVDFEGYLFPDTYRVFMDASVEDIARKMIDNMSKKLDQDLLAEIERQGKTVHEIMTMASIIEKEVRGDKDKALVSGVLNKRLEIGMRLEVDSSINYISGKNDPSATYEDLQLDSPYNTYQNDGLPPGPICNPGLESIMAAVYPEESPYLFYLNRQDTGETIFSRTFDEHISNKNKYLK